MMGRHAREYAHRRLVVGAPIARRRAASRVASSDATMSRFVGNFARPENAIKRAVRRGGG